MKSVDTVLFVELDFCSALKLLNSGPVLLAAMVETIYHGGSAAFGNVDKHKRLDVDVTVVVVVVVVAAAAAATFDEIDRHCNVTEESRPHQAGLYDNDESKPHNNGNNHEALQLFPPLAGKATQCRLSCHYY